MGAKKQQHQRQKIISTSTARPASTQEAQQNNPFRTSSQCMLPPHTHNIENHPAALSSWAHINAHTTTQRLRPPSCHHQTIKKNGRYAGIVTFSAAYSTTLQPPTYSVPHPGVFQVSGINVDFRKISILVVAFVSGVSYRYAALWRGDVHTRLYRYTKATN